MNFWRKNGEGCLKWGVEELDGGLGLLRVVW